MKRQTCKEWLLELKEKTPHHASTSNDANMRERHIVMTGNTFTCIEGNTSGWFIETDQACMGAAFNWLKQC